MEVLFLRNSFVREDAAFCFVILIVGFMARLSSCHASRFSLAVKHSFLKELAIAKTAKYYLNYISLLAEVSHDEAN